MSAVRIQVKQFYKEDNRRFHSKTLTVEHLGDYHTIYNLISNLFETLRENKGNNEVTMTFKIPKRELT